MRYAISVPPAVPPAELVACARAAEEAGWDAFFVWDHVYVADGWALHDPWVVLGAVAAATGRIRLGAMVTPLARRRPWKLAKEIITLDHLSAGRVIIGVGLGAPDEDFTAFGEPAEPRVRAAALDEALAVLDGFLRGDEVVHDGPQFHVRARLTPASVQRPRPPIWVAATWPHRRPLARAARYDGVFALGRGNSGGLSPTQVREVRALLGPDTDIVVPFDSPAEPHAAGEPDTPAASGEPDTPVASGEPGRFASPAELAEAGATWYVVGPAEHSEDWLARLRRVIDAGPPA